MKSGLQGLHDGQNSKGARGRLERAAAHNQRATIEQLRQAQAPHQNTGRFNQPFLPSG